MNSTHAQPVLPIGRIVAPIDFSEPSLEALAAAQELARHFTAELIIVHFVDPVTTSTIAPEPHGLVARQPVMVDFVLAAEARLGELARERIDPAINHRGVVKPGSPADGIVDTADQEQADLIVIATHGRTGVKRLLFGSVAEKVVRTARCPVLTIRRKKNGA